MSDTEGTEEYGDAQYSASPQMACIDARLDELEELAAEAGAPGGGGGYVVAGPLAIDLEQLSGQDLFDGVKIGRLTPGTILHDIAWRTPVTFDGYTGNVPEIVYAGTSEVNFLRAISGDGWQDNPAGEIQETLEVGTAYDAVGAWLMPSANDNLNQSLLRNLVDLRYPYLWGQGILVPETADLDLFVKIKYGSDPGDPTDATVGRVEFYVHLFVPSVPA